MIQINKLIYYQFTKHRWEHWVFTLTHLIYYDQEKWKGRSDLWKQKSADGIVSDGIGKLLNCIMDEFDADVIYTESDEIERLSTTQSLVDITVPDPVIVRGAGTTTLWVHLLFYFSSNSPDCDTHNHNHLTPNVPGVVLSILSHIYGHLFHAAALWSVCSMTIFVGMEWKHL